jgi:hypothetical protein
LPPSHHNGSRSAFLPPSRTCARYIAAGKGETCPFVPFSHIDIGRIKLDRMATAAGPLCGDDGGAGARQRLVNGLAGRGVVLDRALLGLELTDLGALGFDLSLTGFSEDEIASLTSLGTIGLTDPDDVPKTPGRATSRRRDLWLLGRRRLICGDSTDPADVERVLDGVRPHLCACDPPYGVNYDPAWRWKLGEAKELATGRVLNDDRADWREAWALFPGDVIYVWHGALHAATVAWKLPALRCARRSSGTRPAWSSAAATITGSMSPAGMP